jgi:hypothetical protein
MDKTQLTQASRKELRIELRSLKREANGIGDGIYLSVGAIIIIIYY